MFQEYARSDLFKRVYLLDNQKISDIMGPVPIMKHWDSLNNLIVSTYHMINVLQNTEALLKSSNQVPATAKIKTLSVVNLEEKKEEVFYDLEYPRAKNFYFALSEEYMKDNKELLSEVRGYVADQQTEKCDTAYAIYKTDYEQNYVYGIHHATFVQEQNLDL